MASSWGREGQNRNAGLGRLARRGFLVRVIYILACGRERLLLVGLVGGLARGNDGAVLPPAEQANMSHQGARLLLVDLLAKSRHLAPFAIQNAGQ
jgi:hypothetical protein